MSLDALLATAQQVRTFLEPRFLAHNNPAIERTTASEGHCFAAAQVLAHVLSAQFGGGWSACEGVYAKPEVLHRVASGELATWSAIEDAGRLHGWAVSTGANPLLVDIPADQFGLSSLIALRVDAEEATPWLHRCLDSENLVENASLWIAEWDAAAQAEARA